MTGVLAMLPDFLAMLPELRNRENLSGLRGELVGHRSMQTPTIFCLSLLIVYPLMCLPATSSVR